MIKFENSLNLSYDKFYIINNELAIVLLNYKWGLVDMCNKVIIPIIYETLTSPFPNLFIAYNGYFYGAFDEQGKLIIPFKYKTYHMLFSTYHKKVLKKRG